MDGYPRSLEEAQTYVGRVVSQDFYVEGESGRIKTFSGVVTSVWTDTNESTGEHCFGAWVRFEDDDTGSIMWDDLLKILVPCTQSPGIAAMSPSTAAPSTGRGTSSKRTASSLSSDLSSLNLPSSSSASDNSLEDDAHNEEVQQPKRSRTVSGHANRKAPVLSEKDTNVQKTQAMTTHPSMKEQTMQARRNQQAPKKAAAPAADALPATLPPLKRTASSGQPANKKQRNEPETVAKPLRSTPSGQSDATQIRSETPIGTSDVAVAAAAEEERVKYRKKGLAGHLKKIVLKDFMCHEHFELTFGPHVTLVSGVNGSGKSAVMQGIQTCLGVSARETGRNKRMDEFIRSGTDVSVVQVTLWNEGTDAYKPDIFGREITIQRRIRRSGGDYNILAANGRPADIGNKKEELNRILTYFNIDASNPMSILTQDTAKGFLMGGSDTKRKKYDMYMQGTMLANIEDSLANVKTLLDKARENLRAVDAELAKQKGEIQVKEDHVQRLQGMERLRVVKQDMEKVAPWQLLKQYEAATQEAVDMVTSQQETLALARNKLKHYTGEREKVNQKIQGMQDSLQRAIQEAENAQQIIQQLKARHAQCSSRSRAAQREYDRQVRTLEDLNNAKLELEQQLRDSSKQKRNDRKVQEAQEQLQQYQQMILDKQAKVQALEEELNTKREEYHAMEQPVESARQQMARQEREVANSRAQLADMQQRLLDMQRSATGSVAVSFGGRKAALLADKVQQNGHRFKYPVLGPLGTYVGIKDSKWSKAIDVALGGVLNHFLCFDMEDGKTLQTLARQCDATVSYKVNKFGIPRHNVQPRYNTQQYMSVMDMVTIYHPDPNCSNAIFNVLIDGASMENVLLIETEKQAGDLVYQNMAGTGFSSVDVEGTTFRRSGGTVSRIPNRRQMPPRLGLDNKQQQAQMQAVIQGKQAELQQQEQQLRSLQQEAQQQEARYRQINQECTKIAIAKNAASKEVQRLQATRAELAAAASSGMTEEDQAILHLTQALQDNEVDINDIQSTLDTCARNLHEAIEAEKEAKKQYEDKRSSPTNGTMQLLDDQLTQLAQQEAAAGKQVDKWAAEVGKAEQGLSQFEAQQAELNEEMQQAQHLAEMACTREEAEQCEKSVIEYLLTQFKPGKVTRHSSNQAQLRPSSSSDDVEAQRAAYLERAMTHDELAEVVKKLEAQLAAAHREAGGNLAELEHELEEMQKRCEKLTIKHTLAKQRINQLMKSYNKRVESYTKLQNGLGRTLDATFYKYMGRRRHIGTCLVDHDAKEMNIRVQIKGRDNPQIKAVEDLKQLSGGERSYTMVALLLAIGTLCENPFRCMDEYDVFMDAIHRRISTETLFEFATQQYMRQFVLLTPQDTGAIGDAFKHLRQEMEQKREELPPQEFLKVVEMPKARQNQQ